MGGLSKGQDLGWVPSLPWHVTFLEAEPSLLFTEHPGHIFVPTCVANSHGLPHLRCGGLGELSPQRAWWSHLCKDICLELFNLKLNLLLTLTAKN